MYWEPLYLLILLAKGYRQLVNKPFYYIYHFYHSFATREKRVKKVLKMAIKVNRPQGHMTAVIKIHSTLKMKGS